MSQVKEVAQAVKEASRAIGLLTRKQKDAGLECMSQALLRDSAAILEANRRDLEAGRAAGMNEGLLDRLMLDEARLETIAQGIRGVAALPDPVGEILSETVRPNGLTVRKVRVPLGVVAMIYEARPNVTVDAAALTLKTGNGVVLRGSASAIRSNIALVASMRRALESVGIAPDAIGLVTDTGRASARELMRLRGLVDVLIPRGSAGLIRDAVENATVPVIETGIGNCHVFIDESASFDMARDIAVNSKISRPSVCNSAEKLLIHKNWPKENVAGVLDALDAAGVELRCCPMVRAMFPDDSRLKELPQEEYGVEYLAMVMGVLIVGDVRRAVRFINTYGSGHTECIVTESEENAAEFLRGVDAAAVNHNVSTRFTDGFEYGFGAEIGISTQKLHARGPMGLPELTSYKYLVLGNGQTR